MQEPKRAKRRRLRDNLKDRYKRLALHSWNRKVTDEEAARRADHPDDCPHELCRNPRRVRKGKDRLTVRERKNSLKD
jgi:hypothetical protein